MARKPRELPKLWVRLPAQLHRKLVLLASAGGNSLNSEIVRRLEHSVAVESPLSADAQRMMDRIEKRMETRTAFEAGLLRLALGLDPAKTERLLRRFTETGEEDKS